MGNIVDYVKEYGRFSFVEKEFSTVDALVLSEFCYLKFDDVVPSVGECMGALHCEEEGDPSVGDKDFNKGMLMSLYEVDIHPNKESLFSDKRYEKDNRALYEAIVESRRFSGMSLGYYVNKIDIAHGTQFSAITFFLDKGPIFVTYRGTDETMVGWQEDFSMALKKPIMGQTLSKEYIDKVAKVFDGDFVVGGHSKGGNLAMYSALCAEPSVKARISKIYDFDGPGFRPEFLKAHDYDDIKEKAVKVIPHSSPVGMMLNTPGSFTVIEAKSVGVLQHNPYNWIVKDGELVPTTLTEQHNFMMQTSNEWLLGLSDEELPYFVDILCWLLDSTEATTTIQFQDDMATHTKALFKAGQEASDEMKEIAAAFVKSYFALAGENMRADVTERYDAFVNELKSRRDGMLEEMRTKTQEMKLWTEEVMADTKAKAEGMVADTKAKAEEMMSKTEELVNDTMAKAEEMMEEAKAKSEEKKEEKKEKKEKKAKKKSSGKKEVKE